MIKNMDSMFFKSFLTFKKQKRLTKNALLLFFLNANQWMICIFKKRKKLYFS